MKRIVTIQDISCVGKCSITVALPIISAMGIEAAILPTAVLSTHTAFKGFTCKDLSDQIEPITEHWLNEGIGFDGIYTGYLASQQQIDQMKKLFKEFKTPNNFIFVDPAMGDAGKLYPAFDEAFAKKMATLCAQADFIVPNITEACFMTGMEYKENYDESYINELLKKTSDLGAKITILTGVGFEKGKTGVIGYDKEKNETYYYSHEKLSSSYHGTGDVFSSACVGAITKGLGWKKAIEIAAEYTAESIRLTMQDGLLKWYGVHFEGAVPYLLELMKEKSIASQSEARSSKI